MQIIVGCASQHLNHLSYFELMMYILDVRRSKCRSVSFNFYRYTNVGVIVVVQDFLHLLQIERRCIAKVGRGGEVKKDGAR